MLNGAEAVNFMTVKELQLTCKFLDIRRGGVL
jgi:hypothetical protein